MSELGEWAKSLFTPTVSGKAEFDKFIQEVNNENAEHLTFQRVIDETNECTPTFEQLSKECILEEATKNIAALKSFENILQDRVSSFTSFYTSLSKSRGSFEAFQNCNGNMKRSLDMWLLYTEQEITIGRQQQALMDLKKRTSEVKEDAKKRLAEYNREISTADKDLANSEKKLAKSKEHLEKYIDTKAAKLPPPSPYQVPPSGHDASDISLGQSDGFPSAPKRYSLSAGSTPASSPHTVPSDETIQKYEREIRDDSRSVLRTLTYRDQASVASRRAYQKLDRSCKNCMVQALSELVAKEREALDAKNALLSKLEESLVVLGTRDDENHFIVEHINHDASMLQGSQALSILGDLMAQQSHTSPSPRQQQPLMTVQAEGLEGSNPSPATCTSPISPNTNTTSKSTITYDMPTHSAGGQRPSYTQPTSDFSKTQESISRIFYNSSSKRELCVEYSSMIKAPFVDIDYRDSSLAKQYLISNPSAMDILSWCLKWKRGGFTSLANFVEQEGATGMTMSRTLELEYSLPLVEAVNYLVLAVQTQQGRDQFVTVLNQFRSKKVDVGLSYGWMCAVLWSVLDLCQYGNDVHSAKIIMMLCQTFYFTADEIMDTGQASYEEASTPGGPPAYDSLFNEDGKAIKKEEEERKTVNRIYLKECICSHTIWHDCRFWEQTLWHCVTEQLQDITFVENAWHDMKKEDREMAIRRVHDITFSQVMAITHSMIELHCSKVQTREFIYRMCAVHQLGEMNRHMLLSHLQDDTEVRT